MRFHHWFGHHHRCNDEQAFHFAGRGRFRPFGGDDELGGPFGGRHGGARFGRMFGHGDLKLILLALIAEQPRHGYQLIRTIEEMGYARVDTSEGGTKKLYIVTDEGRAYLDENRDTVDALIARMEVTARAASKYAAPLAIHEAMRTLKRALIMRGALWSEAEAKRVRAIIEKAAAEISKG